jgi:hypothetical protein
LGMWWRRSWFSLNGKVSIRGSGEERTSYAINQLSGRSVQQGCHCAQLKPPQSYAGDWVTTGE